MFFPAVNLFLTSVTTHCSVYPDPESETPLRIVLSSDDNYLCRRFPVPESLGELLRVRREVRENNSVLLGRVQRLDYATDQIHLTTIYKVNIYLFTS
jgi:hypothetical protein